MTIQEIRQKAANYYSEIKSETPDEYEIIDFAAKFAFKELGLQRAEEEAGEVVKWQRGTGRDWADFVQTEAVNTTDLSEFDGKTYFGSHLRAGTVPCTSIFRPY